jgi:hypothetical protein
VRPLSSVFRSRLDDRRQKADKATSETEDKRPVFSVV